MKLNEFAQEVHKNAVAHGWYDKEVTFPEVAVMIHAEISEAVEEWREGKPLIYGCCGFNGAECEYAQTCDKPFNDGTCKPEGVAIELCDAVIRILDYLSYLGVDIEAAIEGKHEYNKGREYQHGGKRA